jgi:predicted GIY-YIG superfamily endonuclease
MIYTEEFSDKSQAMKKEKWLKSGVGREFIKKLDH